MPKKSKPKTSPKADGTTITTDALASLAGMTRRRVEQLVKEGAIPRCGRGLHPRDRALSAMFNHFRTRAADTKSALREAMTRSAEAKADIAEVEAEEARRSVIKRDDVAAFIIGTFAPVREQLLAMPGKLAPRANPESPEVARAVLQSWADDTLHHCREKLPEGPAA